MPLAEDRPPIGTGPKHTWQQRSHQKITTNKGQNHSNKLNSGSNYKHQIQKERCKPFCFDGRGANATRKFSSLSQTNVRTTLTFERKSAEVAFLPHTHLRSSCAASVSCLLRNRAPFGRNGYESVPTDATAARAAIHNPWYHPKSHYVSCLAHSYPRGPCAIGVRSLNATRKSLFQAAATNCREKRLQQGIPTAQPAWLKAMGHLIPGFGIGPIE